MLGNRFISLASLLLSLVFFRCSETGPTDTSDLMYWAQPTWEAYVLVFDSCSTVRADTVLAGLVQYGLERARDSYPVLDSISAFPSWELGVLIVEPDDSLFVAYNPTICRFGYGPLDSLLTLFPPDSSQKRTTGVTPGYIKFYYSLDYNIPILASYFSAVPAVRYATPNTMGIYPEACYTYVFLQILPGQFRFEFWRTGLECAEEHFWEVYVKDDVATLTRDQQL